MLLSPGAIVVIALLVKWHAIDVTRFTQENVPQLQLADDGRRGAGDL